MTISPETCRCCGAIKPLRTTYHGLTVVGSPWRVIFAGAALKGFTPLECQVLFTVMSARRTSTAALALLLSERAIGTKAITTYVSRINSRLKEAGIPVCIENIASGARQGASGKPPAIYRIAPRIAIAGRAAARQAIHDRIDRLTHRLNYDL